MLIAGVDNPASVSTTIYLNTADDLDSASSGRDWSTETATDIETNKDVVRKNEDYWPIWKPAPRKRWSADLKETYVYSEWM